MNITDAQFRAQSELESGESLSWAGTADPRRAAIGAIPAAIFGIPFAGFALFWMSEAFRATNTMSRTAHNSFVSGFKVFPLFGVPFLLIGLAITLAPLWAFLKGKSTVYAVTNRRVMVISGTNSRAVQSFTPADIASVEHRERPDGSGDIVLMTNTLQRRGNNIAIPMKVALCGIPNVKQVAEQVLALHTQAVPA
ncbi:MAG TPA: PH domain-containing protein [Candidatus Acidoferrales bacterium]|nr:PH domain-containing protein [Candidatus Acidoferrales bacterium]